MTRLRNGLAHKLAQGVSRVLPPGVAGRHALAGLVLLAVAAGAMAVANSPFAQGWQMLLDRPLPGFSRPGPAALPVNQFTGLLLTLPGTARGWINEGLMAVFFFAIGLEIKREVLVGDLAHAPTRRLPVLAAAAGMAGPTLVFALVVMAGVGAGATPAFGRMIARGWAIPAATDIAFALGVLGLLGRRVPASLRLFLLTVAVVDDLGATAIIALAYAGPLVWGWIGAGGLVLAAMAGLNLAGYRRGAPYVVLAVGLWACVLASGLHPTVAGVLAAMCVPITPSPRHRPLPGSRTGRSLLLRMEHALEPWSAFVIVPLFGLANAGVAFDGAGLTLAPLTLAVAGGLVVGKQVGVFGAVWLAQRTGFAAPPRGANWAHVWGVSLLCGIGFTMSLLIATLAFPHAPALAAQARLGIMGGSLVSALLGLGVLWWAAPKDAHPI